MLLGRILVGVTFLVIIGYFVLLTSSRTEGALRAFGKYLAIWLFVLAALSIVAAAVVRHRHGGMMHGPGMERPWFHQGHGSGPDMRRENGGTAPAQPPATGTVQPAPSAAPAQ